VTISDHDLEARLRDLGTRAADIAPAPVDLADRVRDRHRALRRRNIGLAAGLAAVLVFIGIPVIASTTAAESDRTHAAAPSAPRSLAALTDLPTRGSLAGDQAWLRGVQQLSWRSLSERFQLPADMAATLPDPPVEKRTVAYAGDVPGGRVALVLGRSDRPSYAWFTGPTGADPAQMSLATLPGQSQLGQPAGLEYTPDRTSARATFVLVGWPGDEVDRLTSRTVDAAGRTTEHWTPLPMHDGAGTVAMDRLGHLQPSPELRIHRAGRPVEALHPDMTLVDMPTAPGIDGVEVADPRGLRGGIDDQDLRSAVEAVTSFYVARPDALRPTLLAGGPVTGDPTRSSVLVGFTFPSGATVAALVTAHHESGENDGHSFSITSTSVAPAGTPILDRFLAVPGPDSLTVSGPVSAVLAEVYDGTGAQLTRFPLTAGAGSAPVTVALSGATVRFLDASGTVVIQTPLTGIVR
jgi:hypothetical protein